MSIIDLLRKLLFRSNEKTIERVKDLLFGLAILSVIAGTIAIIYLISLIF